MGFEDYGTAEWSERMGIDRVMRDIWNEGRNFSEPLWDDFFTA
jgi:hypothetical protein